MYFTMLSKAFLSMTAFIKFEVSFGEPTLIFFTSFINFCSTVGQIDFGIYALDIAEHFCP